MDSVVKRAITIVLAAVMILAVFGCEGQPLSTREKGTLAGGGLGAATGAIIGAATGSPGAGAAIGATIGAGVGTAGVLTQRGKDIRLDQGQQLRIRTNADAEVQ